MVYHDTMWLDTSSLKQQGYHQYFYADASEWRKSGNYHVWAWLLPTSQSCTTAKRNDCLFGVIYDKDDHFKAVAWAGDRTIVAPGETLHWPNSQSLWAMSLHEKSGGLDSILMDWSWRPQEAGSLMVLNLKPA